jgi:hypothetical protein
MRGGLAVSDGIQAKKNAPAEAGAQIVKWTENQRRR